MHNNRTTARVIARLHYRGIITTLLLIALSVMIVKDIILRRWGSAPPASDVTRRSP
jgi:hypothetical protein